MTAAGAAGRTWHADDVVERSPRVYSVSIDGEAVLLDEESDRLHHLNAPAALVWECLDGHATVGALAHEISEELGESYENVLAGTLAILRDLDEQELLVEVTGAVTGQEATAPSSTDQAPVEPRWRRRPDALWRRSLDAVLVLPAGADEPITLAGTGPALWELLAEPCTVPQLVAVLSEGYGAEPATVEVDVRPVVDELVRLEALESV